MPPASLTSTETRRNAVAMRFPSASLLCVQVPKTAPPNERRVAYHTLLADHVVRSGRSILPTGHKLEALVEAGLCREEQLPRVMAAYAATSAHNQATHWDAVPASWTGPGGWKAKLGPAKTALVLGLRAMLQRNPSKGTSRRLLHLSAEQLASLAAVSPRTIYRWLAQDTASLADLLALQQDETPRYDTRGRRLPSVYRERLERGYLRLFVQAWASTRKDSASGRVYTWKYWIDVLPTDPVSDEEFGSFIQSLYCTDTTSAGPCTDIASALEYPDSPKNTEPDVASSSPMPIRKAEHRAESPEYRVPEGGGAVVARVSGGEWSPARSQAWCADHYEQISLYRRRIDELVRGLTEHWYDAAPTSTVTRAATLLLAGAVPLEEAATALYEASDAAKAAHVATMGRRVPAFLWALQERCIDDSHPTWWPRPSERGVIHPWGTDNTIRAGRRHHHA